MHGKEEVGRQSNSPISLKLNWASGYQARDYFELGDETDDATFEYTCNRLVYLDKDRKWEYSLSYLREVLLNSERKLTNTMQNNPISNPHPDGPPSKNRGR